MKSFLLVLERKRAGPEDAIAKVMELVHIGDE